MSESSENPLAFVVPLAGQVHQRYLCHLYDRLDPLPRQMVSVLRPLPGWRPKNESPISLASDALAWRAANALRRHGWNLLTQGADLVPHYPLEWRGTFRRYLDRARPGALLVTYAGGAIGMLEELERSTLPLAVTFEGSDAQIGDAHPWYGRRLRALWDRADICIFVSQFLKRQACQRGCPPEKAVVLYRGVPIPPQPAHPADDGDLRVLCVASLLPVKGHRWLLEAFALARRQVPAMRLILLGDGPLMNPLKAQARRLGIQSTVEFRGAVPWEQVQSEMSRAHLYVQPSVPADDGSEEGLGLAVLEAQAWGVPAIVSRSGGLPETIEDQRTGLVVMPGDVQACAAAIAQKCATAAPRREMAAAARHRAMEIYNLDQQSAAWRKLLQSLIDRTFREDVSGQQNG